jgi:hypothetical protein
MAVIYLKHPEHGVKVACLDLEAEADEENGWIRFDPDGATPEPKNVIASRRRSRVENDSRDIRDIQRPDG